MKKFIPIVIPAKNEETRIEATINSLINTFKNTNFEPKFVVVDDGSVDRTAEIAIHLGCNVIELEDRGYSALGKPELANTHNAGFLFIKDNFDYNEYDYIMVVGADTTFEKDYLQKILQKFKEDTNLVMCAGVIDGLKTNRGHVRGSGRLIDKDFWKNYGEKLPNKVHGWESHPIYWANFKGFNTLTVDQAIMRTCRPPMMNTDWQRYGKAMREYGSLFPYVLFRAIKAFIKISPYQAYRLITGYFQKPLHTYEPDLMEYIKNHQKIKMMNLFIGKV